MAIASTSSSSAPFAKLVELGDTIIGALGSDPNAPESRRQMINFTTRLPEVKADGKPRMEEIIHLVALPGTTAKLGTPEAGYQPIEPGSHIRYSLSGYKWGQAIDARKQLPTYSGVPAGRPASGDIYTITLTGWSAQTDNAAAATAAGFTVVDGRIILRSQEEREQFILARSRANQSIITAAEVSIAIRRPSPAEAAWEAQADALWLSKPWLGNTTNPTEASAPADGGGYDPGAPF